MAREIGRHIEKRYKNGKPLCLVPICNKYAEQFKSGRYRNYCKKHTFTNMLPFVNWQYLSQKIMRRDGYKCVKCGDDKRFVNEPRNAFNYLTGRRERRWEQVSNLEVDHIREVANGGDMWDESNLQTLCRKCHKAKTKYYNKFERGKKLSGVKTSLRDFAKSATSP